MGIGQEWATPENELGYTPDLHISGTTKTPNGLTFWLYRPRPVGVSVDEWEAQEQARWNRIFGKKEVL
jgi:hypothetical protein